MSRVLRIISGLFVDVWQGSGHRSDLRIDMKRVNVELRRVALEGLTDDVAYRDRVKERIRDGARCTHPPLVARNKVLQFPGARGPADAVNA